MLLIKILRIFTQEDHLLSLQQRIHNIINDKAPEEVYRSLKQEYLFLIFLAQKIKFKKSLSLIETKFLAKNYKSLTNELNGKSVKHLL